MSDSSNAIQSSGTELLGVLLKAIGAWGLIGGLSGLPQAVSFWRIYPDDQAVLEKLADTFASPIGLTIVGVLLFSRTNWFVAIAMPNARWGEIGTTSEHSRDLLCVILKALGFSEILNGIVRLPYEFARLSRARSCLSMVSRMPALPLSLAAFLSSRQIGS